ncbi:hypothetical protein DRQ50_00050 [bacterium]|nr:MAG: hypothetical protein DRQ50_00050 [bacterium]
MSLVTINFVLTGGRTGMTGILAKRWQCRDGMFRLSADESIMHKKTSFFGRYYAAFPEGSAELSQALEVDRGNSKLQKILRTRKPTAVPSNAQPVVGGAAEVPPTNGRSTNPTGPATSQHVPPGDGHKNAGVDGTGYFQKTLREAVAELDKDNDDHWTVEGLPRVETVAALMNKPDLSRRDLNDFAAGMLRPVD